MLALENIHSPSAPSNSPDSFATQLFLSIFISFCPCCHQHVFFSPSLVSITSPSHRLPFSTPIFSPSLCPNLTSSVALPYVHCSLLCICTCYIWVQALLGGSPSPPSARPNSSLLNSCHENQTDTLNWCSRLKETGLKYLHNFTEDGGNC